MPLFPRSFEEWYKPLSREEKIWLLGAFLVAIILAITTIGWHFIIPTHQVPTIAKDTMPEEFYEMAKNFESTYRGKIIPENVEIYLAAAQFYWTPSKLILKKGVVYKIWISSVDVMHGFSLIGQGDVYNLMVMPGMMYLLQIKFEKTGTYYIICNEYCGSGHGLMRATIEVVP